MKKSWKAIIWIIAIVLIFIISFFISFNNSWKAKPQVICCNNNCFNIEIADNDTSRQLLLRYRESMPNNNWMLFIFDKVWIHSFWMKNTLIPLAWIRLDSNLNIVDIILMDPCKTEECPSYKPQTKAQYVLEINQRLISEKWLIHTWDNCKLFYSKLDFQKRELCRKIKWNWNVLKSKF